MGAGADRMYDLAIVSYVLALGHFATEAAVYGTAGLQGLAGPLIVSCMFTETRSLLVCAPVAWARLPWGRTTLDLESPPLRRALCRVPLYLHHFFCPLESSQQRRFTG